MRCKSTARATLTPGMAPGFHSGCGKKIHGPTAVLAMVRPCGYLRQHGCLMRWMRCVVQPACLPWSLIIILRGSRVQRRPPVPFSWHGPGTAKQRFAIISRNSSAMRWIVPVTRYGLFIITLSPAWKQSPRPSRHFWRGRVLRMLSARPFRWAATATL